MPDSTQSPARHKIGSYNLEAESFDDACQKVIDRLTIMYCMLQPEKSAHHFSEEILKPLCSGTPDGTTSFEITIYADHSKHTYSGLMRKLLASCSHCIQADVANAEGMPAVAWQHLANAMYELGALEGLFIVEPAVAHVLSHRSSAGAKRRDEKYAPLRELARTLASKKPYTSKRQAALSIKEEILAASRKMAVDLSETQAERTITGWLNAMSFGGKRKP